MTACKSTGEDVLYSLSFNGHTTSYAVFGLGMCLLGFLSVAFIILYASRENYTMIGHKGAKFDKIASSPAFASTTTGGGRETKDIELVPVEEK